MTGMFRLGKGKIEGKLVSTLKQQRGFFVCLFLFFSFFFWL